MSFRVIFLTLLGVAAVRGTPAIAQSTQDRCAELKAEMAALNVEIKNRLPELGQIAAAIIKAERSRLAIEGSYDRAVWYAVSNAEAYSTRAMLQFREANGLPAELDIPIRAGRAAEFWRRAEPELRRINQDRHEPYNKLQARHEQKKDEYNSLKCESAPREASEPLPIERRPDGQPIITDALITRWVKASYALKNTGGAYWQAGQMTQQDYVEVDRRINLYFNIVNSGRAAEQFSDDEMRAMNARLPDIRNVREGNWSQIRLQ
jgi:hypothetical protein